MITAQNVGHAKPLRAKPDLLRPWMRQGARDMLDARRDDQGLLLDAGRMATWREEARAVDRTAADPDDLADGFEHDERFWARRATG